MRKLFHDLGPIYLLNVSQVVDKTKVTVEIDDFLKGYDNYLEQLQENPHFTQPSSKLSLLFSSAITTTTEVIYLIEVGLEETSKYKVKWVEPLIQMQPYRFSLSTETGKCLSMPMSLKAISWGLQLSYPRWFHDGKNGHRVNLLYANTAYFQNLSKWIRLYTTPVTFLWEGKEIVTSLRLGKQSYSWINELPQMKAHQMTLLPFLSHNNSAAAAASSDRSVFSKQTCP